MALVDARQALNRSLKAGDVPSSVRGAVAEALYWVAKAEEQVFLEQGLTKTGEAIPDVR